MATPLEIKASIDNGIKWLVEQQSPNGSWAPEKYPRANTGLALLKLETYALELGFKTPFDIEYKYKDNVIAGLKYIFSEAILDGNGIHFKDDKYTTYPTGIILAALCASSSPDNITTIGNAVYTYKQVADLIVKYLEYSQSADGGWSYSDSGGISDNSNSGYPTLGLEFAKSPTYKFECVIPQTLKDKLNLWIDYIQYDNNGGSGYQTPEQWVNILKTGSLIQEMHLFGDSTISARLQKATTYIADHWKDPIQWLASDGGWIDRNDGNPIRVDYQATFTTMKSLEGYGIDIIKTSANPPDEIDWYAEMADAIVKLQNGNGSWPITQKEDTILLCTIWALLTLEKAAPPSAYISYQDNVNVSDPYNASSNWNLNETIEVLGEIKIFAKKYSHSEAECDSNKKPSKGDDIGFTLVFGNYGEFNYTATKGTSTVEDTLIVQYPVNLKLMSLCICDDYKLFYGNTNVEVEICDTFYGETGLYNLQLRKKVGDKYIADFDLPCHYICSISMLLQIEFPACPRCPGDYPKDK